MDSDVKKPKLIAMAAGKGGVGKSVLSILLSQWLVRMGKRIVLVDLDLGGANAHTLMGIKQAPLNLGDFVAKRVQSLEEVAIQTQVENLRLVCGSSEVLSVANPHFVQKLKIMRSVARLEADYVVLDLGAGTGFNVLDFFLMADVKVVITTAEPIAIYNAYSLLRNAVFRRLSQMSRHTDILRELVRTAMDPNNKHNLASIRELWEVISELGGEEVAEPIREELQRIAPSVIVNQMRNAQDINVVRILRHVSEKYLTIEVSELGGVLFDRDLQRRVAEMKPLTEGHAEGGAYESMCEIANTLVANGEGFSRRPELSSANLNEKAHPQARFMSN